MLQKRIPVWMLVVAVGVLLILFGIGSAIHSAGWQDGFTMGLLTSSTGDGSSLTSYLAFRNASGWNHGGFGFIGGLFRFLFFLLVIGMIFRFLGFRRWKDHGPHGPWSSHRSWRHQGTPWSGPVAEGAETSNEKTQNTTSIHL